MKKPKSALEESSYLDKGFIIKLVIALLLVFLFLGLYELFLKTFQVFLLTVSAVLWAILFRAPADFFTKKGLNRKWSTLISVLLILGIFIGLYFLIIPQLVQEIPKFQEKIPEALEQLKSNLSQFPLGERIVNEINNPGNLFQNTQSSTLNVARSFFTSAFGVLADLFIIIVVGFFFLSSPSLYKTIIVKAFPLKKRKRVREVLKTQYATLKSWLVGKLFDMLVVAILTTIGLYLLDMPLAITLGILAGLLAFIPNLGPLLAQIPAILIAYLQGPQYVLYVLILYNGIQLLESNLLLPMIQQYQVSVPPGLILLFQVLLGIVTGLLGLILAVPLLVLIMVFLKMVYLQDTLGDPTVDIQEND